MTKKPTIYAIQKGRKTGVFRDHDTCLKYTSGYSGAIWKKFATSKQAELFVQSGKTTKQILAATREEQLQESETASTKIREIAIKKKRQRPNKVEFIRIGVVNTRAINIEPSENNKLNKKNTSMRMQTMKAQKRKCEEDSESQQPAKKLRMDEEDDKFVIKTSSPYNKKGNVKIPTIYTDGSFRCIEGRKSAGYGVWWGEGHPNNLSGSIVHNSETVTSEKAELEAVSIALRQAIEKGYKKVVICTDSLNVIMGVQWARVWRARGWMDEQHRKYNKAEYKEILEILQDIEVEWRHVKAHIGILGNYMADELAAAGRNSSRSRRNVK